MSVDIRIFFTVQNDRLFVTTTMSVTVVKMFCNWPVGDDGRLYAGRKTTADGEHVRGELDSEVLEAQWSVHDDAVQKRDHFRRSTASRRRMDELYIRRRSVVQLERKALRTCWDSATREPSDAEIIAAKVLRYRRTDGRDRPTDRVTTPTRTGLRRCRTPCRARAHSCWCDNKNGRRSILNPYRHPDRNPDRRTSASNRPISYLGLDITQDTDL